jgi:hypothetical protein
MRRKLPLFLALTILSGAAFAGVYKCQDAKGYFAFSDKPCASDSTVEAAPAQNQSDSNSQSEQSAPNRGAYTREMRSMPSPDAATQACFNYMNTTALFPDPSTTKLLSSTKKWVGVKGVGSRQLVTIGVTSKNEAGMYIGVQSLNCLLMGDSVTVNTGVYELL